MAFEKILRKINPSIWCGLGAGVQQNILGIIKTRCEAADLKQTGQQ
jgi:hypothetical protein